MFSEIGLHRVLRRARLCLPSAVLAILAVVAFSVAALAQSTKVFHWIQYDYDIQILSNGDMLYAVTMTFSFDRGSFHQGYYEFNLDRVDDVRDVEVWEGDHSYRSVDAEADYGFQVNKGDTFQVLWWFPYTDSGTRTFTLKFRVVGGLRIYDDGDQFYWNFYAGDRPARIERGVITVHLPGAVPADQLRMAASPDSVTIKQVDEKTVQATVASFPANTTAVLRIQFPHGLVRANKPSWQAADDRRVAYNERWRPLVELSLLGLSVLVLFGGTGGVIALWYTRGRDKPVGPIAEYVTEPPSDLAPGLAGTLVDERADVKDVLATIVDLGRRGMLEIEEREESGLFGIGSKKDFIYRLKGRDSSLLKHEQILLDEFFGSRTEKRLSELKNKFYAAIPRIAKAMYAEVTDMGYFAANPEKTRNKWVGVGIVGLIATLCGFFAMSMLLASYASTFFCLPVSAAVAFVAMLITAGFMPRKTEKGAIEAAKWQAFRRYLQDIERYDNLQEKTAIFERFLPYAIAFGVEKSYIKKFAQVQAPAPRWYYPYPPVILHSPGSYGRQEGGMMPTSEGSLGTPSLQSMSNSMASSLQSMSDGLVSMLNSAANTLTSSPSSSSSRHGGWSGGGGGFGGGGGGGGGSGAR